MSMPDHGEVYPPPERARDRISLAITFLRKYQAEGDLGDFEAGLAILERLRPRLKSATARPPT